MLTNTYSESFQFWSISYDLTVYLIQFLSKTSLYGKFSSQNYESLLTQNLLNKPIYVVKSQFWVFQKQFDYTEKHWVCLKNLTILETNFVLADGLGKSKENSTLVL